MGQRTEIAIPKADITLLSNGAASGSARPIPQGGTYVWSYQGTWSGATLTLNVLGPDGTNYIAVATATADGSKLIAIGADSTVKVTISGGPPSGIYSQLSRCA